MYNKTTNYTKLYCMIRYKIKETTPIVGMLYILFSLVYTQSNELIAQSVRVGKIS